MSWAKVRKINSNFNKPLNEQARELAYVGSYLFTASTTFTPEKSGWYKIIVVGKGGDGDYKGGDSLWYHGGGAGGVAISTRLLSSNDTYDIVLSATTASSSAGTVSETYYSSFEDIIAYNGAAAYYSSSSNYNCGKGGHAVGGDFNYKGEDGASGGLSSLSKGASVGVYIPELTRATTAIASVSYEDIPYNSECGDGILGHGGTYSFTHYYYGGSAVGAQPTGCVLIIPLELEE